MPKRPSGIEQSHKHTSANSEASHSEEELEFEDPYEDEMEEEEIVEEGEGEEEEEEEEEETRAFRPGVDSLEEDEELVAAEGAYKFLHKLQLDWPCLTFDFLDSPQSGQMKFPLDVSVVAGTQADRRIGNDKLYVMRWSGLTRNHKTEEDSEDSEEESEDEEEGVGRLHFRQIAIEGGASNRVRTMPQMRSIVSVFSEDGKVRMFNIQKAMDEVNREGSRLNSEHSQNTQPLFETAHETEGYGLAWNPWSVGQLVSGDEDGGVKLWAPVPGGSWEVAGLTGGEGGVMDVAWKESNVFASCHGGGDVKMWDVRSGASVGGVQGTGVDVNGIAWNPQVSELILTGSDDGSFKIYDARNFRVHLAHFHWHKEQITSVAWHPVDETTLLVASADDSISFWDMSVEADEATDELIDYPAQLLFLHQGQQFIKEAKFSTKYPDAITSTAADGFNFFRTCNI